MSSEEVLTLAGRAESGSEHPLGRAVTQACADHGIDISGGCHDFEAVPGRGLRCMVDGKEVV